MVCKNNKRNRKRAAFYRISKFDYETREKLVEEQPPPKETLTEKIVEYSLENEWIEV